MDYFEFFCLNLGKLYNYMRYFGSNNAFNGVAESWVVTEMSWVEMGARFSNAHKKNRNWSHIHKAYDENYANLK